MVTSQRHNNKKYLYINNKVDMKTVKYLCISKY